MRVSLTSFLRTASRSMPQPPCDTGPRDQCEKYTDRESGNVRPPGHRAERRADEREQQLQQNPETDQYRGGNTHEFKKKSERQHEPEFRARKQREVSADDG